LNPIKQSETSSKAEPASLHRLLRALASFNVVAETAPAHFVLTPFGEPLRKDAPGSEWAPIIFWADLLADSWSYLTECIKSGDNAGRVMERAGVASRWSRDPNAGAIFRAVMGTAPAEDYMPIARAWDFSNYNVVADLGGGGGALMSAVLMAVPNLRGMLVDRPESIDQATSRFESAGLAARCRFLAADLCNAVPAGADVYMMKHVLHGYDDTAASGILRNCRSVLPDEGRLLVIEFVLPDVVDHADLELEIRLMSDLNMLGARPRIRRGRVPSAAGANARRRDAGDVSAHRRGAPTQQMPPRRRNPKGAWGLHGDRGVARRQRCTTASPPPRALRSPGKPHARDPF